MEVPSVTAANISLARSPPPWNLPLHKLSMPLLLSSTPWSLNISERAASSFACLEPGPTALPREQQRRMCAFILLSTRPQAICAHLDICLGASWDGSWERLRKKCLWGNTDSLYVLVPQIRCCLLCSAVGALTVFCAEIILETLDFSIQGKPKPLEGA